jgi:PmbA protein
MKQKKEYMELAKYAVDQAMKAGADAADAFITDSQNVEIYTSNRSVESVNASSDAGVGIRILKDQKMIFASNNDLSKDAIKEMIADLMKKVPFHTPDEFNVIYAKEFGVLEGEWSSYKDLLSYDPKITEIPVEDKITKAVMLETSGLDHSPKIAGSMLVIYQDQASIAYLANSNGISGWFPSGICGGVAMLSAADGDERQSGTHVQVGVKYEDLDPTQVGKKAAEKAVQMLGAKPIKSCEVPMVVSPDIGVDLLSYIVGMLSADPVQKGKSLFAGKIGESVAASSVSLIDDGKLKGGLATAPVDGEGVPTQTTSLIAEGVLKNYLFDCYNAKKGKTKSTGNRIRGSYQSSGGIGSTNLYMKSGNTKPEEIIAGIKDGFYLTVAFGLHAGINDVTGDFSLPVAGFKIENGQKTFPIRGITIGGNLFDFLKSVDKIGDDLTWIQSTGCPTFSVESIKIGGV